MVSQHPAVCFDFPANFEKIPGWALTPLSFGGSGCNFHDLKGRLTHTRRDLCANILTFPPTSGHDEKLDVASKFLSSPVLVAGFLPFQPWKCQPDWLKDKGPWNQYYGLWTIIMVLSNIMVYVPILWHLLKYYGPWFIIRASDPILGTLIQYYGLWSNIMTFDPILWPLIQYYDLWSNSTALDPILWPLFQYYGLWLDIMVFDISIIASDPIL